MAIFDAGVKAHMEAFAEQEKELSMNFTEEGWSKYLTFWKNNGDGCVMIRPSGNPIDMPGFKGMFQSDDIKITSHDLVEIHDVQVIAGGKAAFTVHTMHSVFEYKGVPNDDFAKFTTVLEEIDGEWKHVHVHRGTGQKLAAAE